MQQHNQNKQAKERDNETESQNLGLQLYAVTSTETQNNWKILFKWQKMMVAFNASKLIDHSASTSW